MPNMSIVVTHNPTITTTHQDQINPFIIKTKNSQTQIQIIVGILTITSILIPRRIPHKTSTMAITTVLVTAGHLLPTTS